MNADITRQQDAILIQGIEVRTSPEKASQDIPATWQRFMQGGFLQRLPLKAGSGHLYAVYCNYERDHAGPYTMVIGVPVDDVTSAIPETRTVQIPAGRYAAFHAKGDISKVIWGAWNHINTAWDGRKDRRYVADFERYPLASLALMQQGQVAADVVVGLKE